MSIAFLFVQVLYRQHNLLPIALSCFLTSQIRFPAVFVLISSSQMDSEVNVGEWLQHCFNTLIIWAGFASGTEICRLIWTFFFGQFLYWYHIYLPTLALHILKKKIKPINKQNINININNININNINNNNSVLRYSENDRSIDRTFCTVLEM